MTQKMKISIGILAYNEAGSIGKTLHSLFGQSVFVDPDEDDEIEIIIVPNGCTDDTADVARIVLADLVTRSQLTRVKYAVCEVAEPGKTNAWNRYVHQFSDPHAKYLLLMDADIEFLGDRTVRNTIDELERNPRANLAVDTPTKDIVLKPNKNWIEKLSLSVSAAATNSTEVWICG
jgi:glycosyltransferase involved in cell wall biosynthesis